MPANALRLPFCSIILSWYNLLFQIQSDHYGLLQIHPSMHQPYGFKSKSHGIVQGSPFLLRTLRLQTLSRFWNPQSLGATGFSSAVSGFVQVLKSDPRYRRSCLRPSAEHVSACVRRNEAPRRVREKPLVLRVDEWATAREITLFAWESNSVE